MLTKENVKIQELLKDFGVESKVTTFDQSTKTSQQAADALGCEVAQIAKSMVFMNKDDRTAILIIASGANRVDKEILENVVGAPVKLADPEFVLEQTGYIVGGVAPIGHTIPPKIYIDKDLLEYEYVWAAAGTSNSVFKINTQELIRITSAEPAVIC